MGDITLHSDADLTQTAVGALKRMDGLERGADERSNGVDGYLITIQFLILKEMTALKL